MNILRKLFCVTIGCVATAAAFGDDMTNLDLSTRWNGVPPTHETPTSAAKWIQNSSQVELMVAVTNFYGATNSFLEVDLGPQKQIFYGAGQDSLGNYIPTNYPPVSVDAELRRNYQLNIFCPNSGPEGSMLFSLSRNDFSSPEGFLFLLTNSPPDRVSAFLWSNFTAQAQQILTNADSNDALLQSNLIQGMNSIITSGSIYDPILFTNVILSADTTNLMAQNPEGQSLVLLNRMLLRDAYGNTSYSLPLPSNRPDNSGTAQIYLSVEPPTQFSINPVTPTPEYAVAINGQNVQEYSDGNALVNLINPGTGYLSTNSSVVELSKDKFQHYGVGDGCDDARPAPGVASWLSIGPGCTQDTNRISIDWSVSLGRTFDGLAAGRIALNLTELSQTAYTPYALFYNAASTNIIGQITVVTTNVALTLITNVTQGTIFTNGSFGWGSITNVTVAESDSVLRQIMSVQTFVDIIAPNTNETVLNFYLPSQVATNQDENGVFTNITDPYPFVTWTIQNGGPGDTNTLLIIENRHGVTSTQSLVRAVSAGTVTWTNTLGTGTEQRIETRQVTFTGGSTPTNRVEVDAIRYAGSAAPAYQCQETYHFYQWGSELVETRVPNNSGNPDLVTSYAYYTSGDPDDPYGYGYSQLKQTIYPDGYWEKRLYGVIDDDEDFGDIDFGSPVIVACQILHPYFDGSSGGATTPDAATSENSSVYDYDISYDWELYKNRADLAFDHGKPTSITTVSESGEMDYNSVEGIDGGNGSWGNYQKTEIYSSEDPPGLSGHSDSTDSGNAYYHYFFYDNGTFDTTANNFILNPVNNIYTWDGISTREPDHRQSEIDHLQGLNSDWMDFDNWGISDPDTDLPVHEYDDPVNGQYLPLLTPAITTMKTTIYHGGSLVQKEKYLYLTGTLVQDYGSGTGLYSDPDWVLLNKIRYYVDSLGRATNIVRIDPVSAQTRTLYSADYRGTSGYDGELLLSETDENGRQISYTYDSLQRVKTMTVKGYGSQPDQVTTYAYDANGQATSQTTTAGSLSTAQSWAFDLYGRLTNHVDQSGIVMQISYSGDGLTITTNLPGSIQFVANNSIDRFPLSVQGNGCVPQFFDHLTDSGLYSHGNAAAGTSDGYGLNIRELTTHFGYSDSPRWRQQGSDVAGNPNAWEQWPIGGGTNTASTSRFYAANYLMNEYDQNAEGSVHTEYYYNEQGNPSIKQNSIGGYTGSNPRFWPTDSTRPKWSKQCDISIGGLWYEVTTNVAYLSDGEYNYTKTLQSIHFEQLNGFTGSQSACSIDYNADTNETITTTTIDRANDKVTVTTSRPNTSSLAAVAISQNGMLISSSSLSVANPTLYFYDALGRTNQIHTSLNFSNCMTYDPKTGWLTSFKDPAGHITYYTYYNTNEANSGHLKCKTDPNGRNTYYAFTTQGKLYRTWGDVPYPAEYRYDEFGDLTNLITYRGGAGWSGSSWPSSPGTGDNTFWQYDQASGALLKKIDAQGNATTYTHDLNTGRLLTRSWARAIGSVPVTVTNYYDGFSELVEQDYDDGTPSIYFNNYNRAGMPREIGDMSGTNELTYDYAGRLVSSACINGLMSGITVLDHFNSSNGLDSVSVQGLSSALEDDFGYDAYGRLGSVSSGSCSATYGYLPNSDLLQSTTCKNGSTTVLMTTRSWQNGFLLANIANVVNGTALTSHSYTYDSVNRRTQAQLEDGSTWAYGYNDRNELTNANRSWADRSAVAGQQYNYAYDNIGNRQSASYGGDTHGGNLQTISYTVNNLNQYTGILTPGEKEIIGVAYAINGVTVNGNQADRKGQYFHKEINVANSGQSVWQSVTNVSGTYTNQGGLIFPANSQVLTYDADGNLSFDGIWSYQWDGENRLISMTMTNVSGIANSNRLRLQFAYDSMGRRIEKVLSAWNGTTFVTQSTNLFVYDGRTLLATLSPGDSVLQSFMWGQDLSRTITKAGGVGGLLMATFAGTNCFACFDGNGNITALVNATDKSTAARYDYSPFGEPIRETGLFARQNPFRFSTKFSDDESGLIYYGYRYYNPISGRWISRDSSGEVNGLHLYGFCRNSAIQSFDYDGDSVQDIVQWFLPISKAISDYIEDPGNPVSIFDGIDQVQKAGDLIDLVEAVKGEDLTLTDVGGAAFGQVVSGAEGVGRTFEALNQAMANLSQGIHDKNGTVLGNAEDFLTACSQSDEEWAELDAITLACQTGGDETGALIAWGSLIATEDVIMQ